MLSSFLTYFTEIACSATVKLSYRNELQTVETVKYRTV